VTYIIALVVSGICWFCFAAVLGSAVPILGVMWVQHLISAVITSLAVGYIFKKPLMIWCGWRWYVLPILTLLVATALYGLLLSLSGLVTATIQGKGSVVVEAFYLTPALMVLYSMTVYIVVLYPLALLTQTVLHKVGRNPAQ
jgi:hypothetical protein